MYKDNIGKIMWDRNHLEKGFITGISSRYCAGCGKNKTCYLVEWEDGKRTKPCVAGISVISKTELIIN